MPHIENNICGSCNAAQAEICIEWRTHNTYRCEVCMHTQVSKSKDLARRYWVISYDFYYPSGFSNDVKITFNNLEEAEAMYNFLTLPSTGLYESNLTVQIYDADRRVFIREYHS